MSVGETQLAAAPVDGESSPVTCSRISRRWPVVCVLLFGVGLLAYSFQKREPGPLTAAEARLVGTWDWRPVSVLKAKVNGQKVVFKADRSLVFPDIVGLDSRWTVVDDRLKITHYYRTTLYRNGPEMPYRKSESFYYTLNPTDSPDRISVKADTIGINSTLTRTK